MTDSLEKMRKDYENYDKKSDVGKIHIQAMCIHKRQYGDSPLRYYEKTKDGKKITAMRCEICKMILPQDYPSVKEVSEAAETLITAYNYFKLFNLTSKDLKNLSSSEREEREEIAHTIEEIIKFEATWKKTVETGEKNAKRRSNANRGSTVVYH